MKNTNVKKIGHNDLTIQGVLYSNSDEVVSFTNLIYGANLDGWESLQLVPGFQIPQFGWQSTIFRKVL